MSKGVKKTYRKIIYKFLLFCSTFSKSGFKIKLKTELKDYMYINI